MVTSVTNIRHPEPSGVPTGDAEMSWESGRLDRVRSGNREGLSAWVMMVDAPDDTAALMAKGRRFRSACAKICGSVWPSTCAAGRPDATSIHLFQTHTRPASSTRIAPPSIASSTALQSWSKLAGIGRGNAAAHADDVIRQQILQDHQRRQVQQHCKIALDITTPDGEVDVDEQYAVVDVGPGCQVEEVGTVAVHDFRQRNPQGASETVGYGAEAAVQQDIPGFSQGFLLEFDDILQREFAAHDGAHEFHALRLGKYQEGAAADVALEILVYRHQPVRLALPEIKDCLLAGHDADVRHRQQDLFLHHFPEAERGIADPQVD